MGASLGAVIAIYFGISRMSAAAVPVFGLAGAVAAMSLTFTLGRGGGTLALILAGAAVSALVDPRSSRSRSTWRPAPMRPTRSATWLWVRFADRSWDHVLLAGPFILAGGAALASTGKSLNALSLGEAQAESLASISTGCIWIALIGTAIAGRSRHLGDGRRRSSV
jgi:iron complex transport system permease protein